MSGVGFFLYTIVSGTLFAYGLLWVIAAWLKADGETAAIENKVREALEQLKAAGCFNPSPGCCPEYNHVGA